LATVSLLWQVQPRRSTLYATSLVLSR
jgi:hypothetical protein